MPARTTSDASIIWSACAVSMTSDEVRPKWSQRADGPTRSATAVVKAIDVVVRGGLDLFDARHVERRPARGCRAPPPRG